MRTVVNRRRVVSNKMDELLLPLLLCFMVQYVTYIPVLYCTTSTARLLLENVYNHVGYGTNKICVTQARHGTYTSCTSRESPDMIRTVVVDLITGRVAVEGRVVTLRERKIRLRRNSGR